MTAVCSTCDSILEPLISRFPQAFIRVLPDPEGYLITIPDFHLPEGFNAETTTLRFIVPSNFPSSRPFRGIFVDDELRFCDGSHLPQSGWVSVSTLDFPVLWMNLKLWDWDRENHDALTFVRVIRNSLMDIVYSCHTRFNPPFVRKP